jgi:hypothetical protein
MKKNHLSKTLAFIYALSYSFIITTVQAQQMENSTTRPENKDFRYYSKKQKNQKTTAWIMLAGGSVLAAGGVVLATKELIIDPLNGEEVNPVGANIMFYGGLASMATSIPLFIASGKNKKRAQISLQQEKITMGNKISQQTNYQSICLKISLGK